MAPTKINVKDRVTEGEIDLSMSGLHDVPVKEIAVFRRVYSLDLSNNELKKLPNNFATSLTHITKLDLSKNQIKELPDNFGDLVKLKHLDLYQNQLQHLPLSFSKLKALKWLDLKDNPLVPAVAKVAGPCLEPVECQNCARDIIKFFAQVQTQVDSELEVRQKQRQKQLEVNQLKEQETSKKTKKKKEKKKAKIQQPFTPESPTYQHPFFDNESAHENDEKSPLKSDNNDDEGFSFLRSISFLFISISVALFISTSVDCKYTQNIKLGTVQIYNQSISMLPSNLQSYGLLGGDYVKILHDNTGVITTQLIDYLMDKDNYLRLQSILISFCNNTINTVKDVFWK